MAQLVIRHLEDNLKARLQGRPRRHGRSTEEGVREIRRNAVKGESAPGRPLDNRLRERFAGIGLEDELPEMRGEVASRGTFGP
jgi:antitoxin FitA